MTDLAVVQHLSETWTSMARLGESLGPEEWDLPTDCPGWSVRDVVAHVIGTESALLGRPSPPPAAEAPHIKNAMGRLNEAWVAAFRGRPGPAVLAEFRDVTAQRREALAAMSDEQMEAETVGPVGPQPYREFMQIRLMDCWVHEQDMRRATRRPGHFEGPAAEAAFSRLVASLPYVVGKRSGAGEGTVVEVDLDGPLARCLIVGVEGGRARFVEEGSGPPMVTLGMEAETYACLATGRWAAADVMAEGRVRIEGDAALGAAVVEQLNVIP